MGVYLYSGATGTGDGSSWINAFTTIAAAITGIGSDGIIYMAHDHAENSFTTTQTWAGGTTAVPTQLWCINRSTDVYAPRVLTDTPNFTSTTNNSNFEFHDNWRVHGVFFKPKLDVKVVQLGSWLMYDGVIQSDQLNGGFSWGDNSHDCYVEVNNVAFKFNQGRFISQGVGYGGGKIVVNGGSLVGDTLTNGIFQQNTSHTIIILVTGMDLSGVDNADPIAYIYLDHAAYMEFTNCKFKVGAPLFNGSLLLDGNGVIARRCSTAGKVYEHEEITMRGRVVESTTTYADYTDSPDAQDLSLQMIPDSTHNGWANPLIGPWHDFYYDGTLSSSITATVECTHDYTSLDQGDVWIEVMYMDSSTGPQFAIAAVRGNPHETFDPLVSTGTKTWTGGKTYDRKIETTFIPEKKGICSYRVVLAKYESGTPDKVFFYDPQIALA